jgi:hypothetical protein
MNREAILAKQIAVWPRHVEGARKGNPWAMLCTHCYGRHGPPHSEICPRDPPGRDRKSERLDRSAAALSSHHRDAE